MITKAKRKLYKRENRLSVIFFVITMIVAIGPLLSRYCINGHDLEYHLLRIESLKEGILLGKPFLKVNALFFGGAGYASSMFYSDLFLYIPAILRVLGFKIGTSYHIYVAVIFALGYLITYYSVYKMSVSKFAASVAAMIFTLCPYHMDDVLLRGACGEYMAFVFIPLAVYGVYNVVFEEMDNPAAFGIGFAGLILSHPATCLLCVLFAFCAMLIFVKRLCKEPSVIARLVGVTLIVLCVTAFFWVPMLEQFSAAKFYVSDNWSDLFDSALGFSEIFSNAFPCLGFISIALFIPRVTLRRKDYPILSFVDVMFLAAALFIIGSSDLIFWDRIGKYFSFLQFPWRLLIMSSTLLAISDGIVLKIFLEQFGEEKRTLIFDAALVAVCVIFSGQAIDRFNENSLGYYDYSNDYYSYEPYTQNVIGGEWLPQTVTDRESLIEDSKLMIFDDGQNCEFVRNRACVESDITLSHDYVDVPFIYYKGYSATLSDAASGKTKLVVTGEGNNGMCRVYLEGRMGHLSVSYKSTVLQIVSYLVSGICFILLIALWYLEERNKRKLRANATKAGAVISLGALFIVVPFILSTLTGCSAGDIRNASERIEQLGDSDKGFSTPDEMLEYMKNRDEEKLRLEEEEQQAQAESLVAVNINKKGYDKEGAGFAVQIDESSGEQVISVLDKSEISKDDTEDYSESEKLYEKLLSDEITKALSCEPEDEALIMNEADLLLCLEIYPGSKYSADITKAATRYAGMIFDREKSGKDKALDKYNRAAVLAKASYTLEEWEEKDEALEVSKDLFEEAEGMTDEESESSAARVFAASELYRLTGMKTYRSVVDASLMDTISEGFSYNEPGYYGLFTYLISNNQGNYKVSSSMMNYIFDKANGYIKEDFESDIISLRIDNDLANHEEEKERDYIDRARLVALAQYVSMSIEYRHYIEKELCYLCGANLSGTDYSDENEPLCDEPLFLLYESLIREDK